MKPFLSKPAQQNLAVIHCSLRYGLETWEALKTRHMGDGLKDWPATQGSGNLCSRANSGSPLVLIGCHIGGNFGVSKHFFGEEAADVNCHKILVELSEILLLSLLYKK